ncbi:hypothetical protein AMJ82_11745, partial [candidate division TA06 bacterium SM23_40]
LIFKMRATRELRGWDGVKDTSIPTAHLKDIRSRYIFFIRSVTTDRSTEALNGPLRNIRSYDGEGRSRQRVEYRGERTKREKTKKDKHRKGRNERQQKDERYE